MSTAIKPFRSLEAVGGNKIHDLKWSLSGDMFISASGESTAKIFDRNGSEISTTVKGDPYIVDMNKTSGHTAALTSCAWHPKDREIYMTSSFDSTVRSVISLLSHYTSAFS